jgi:hypothetical protein
LFALLLLCPETGEPLSLGFLTLAPRFRLGCGFRFALLLCLSGGLALLLCLHGGLALLFSLLSRIRLHCPWQRKWHVCRE